jgi:putative exporter of polyketide antibiotics
MRSHASQFVMKICAPMHHIFYYENMHSLAIRYFYESMCSHASNVLLWNYALTRIKYLLGKYALPYASCVSLRTYVLTCMLCFLIGMKDLLINMQTGVCVRFLYQTGGSGPSEVIFDSIAVTYIVCSFSLCIIDILWFMAVRHKLNSLMSGRDFYFPEWHTALSPCIYIWCESTRHMKLVALRVLEFFLECCWGFRSSVLWRRVVWRMVSDVCEGT